MKIIYTFLVYFTKINKNTIQCWILLLNTFHIKLFSINYYFLFFQSIAQVYWNEKNYVQARHHYLYSSDGKGCAKLLIEFQMTQGYCCEVDLFIAQAVLQFLCLSNKNTASQTFNNYTKEHPRINKSGPPYLFPLLNFIWFLLQAIERYVKFFYL